MGRNVSNLPEKVGRSLGKGCGRDMKCGRVGEVIMRCSDSGGKIEELLSGRGR